MKADKWIEILIKCGVRKQTASKWAVTFENCITQDSFSRVDELDDFLAQILHESAMLERTEENLNYSAKRISEVWNKRFPTPESAEPYARNPQALANKVYGGRMGNTLPNDGWNYRGRGLIMVTGKDNYTAVSNAIGIDLVAEPEKLAQPEVALKASVAWWEGNIPDEIMGNVKKITRKVNGGIVGLAHREQLASLANDAIE